MVRDKIFDIVEYLKVEGLPYKRKLEKNWAIQVGDFVDFLFTRYVQIK